MFRKLFSSLFGEKEKNSSLGAKPKAPPGVPSDPASTNTAAPTGAPIVNDQPTGTDKIAVSPAPLPKPEPQDTRPSSPLPKPNEHSSTPTPETPDKPSDSLSQDKQDNVGGAESSQDNPTNSDPKPAQDDTNNVVTPPTG